LNRGELHPLRHEVQQRHAVGAARNGECQRHALPGAKQPLQLVIVDWNMIIQRGHFAITGLVAHQRQPAPRKLPYY
jgi:hypothetical protein